MKIPYTLSSLIKTRTALSPKKTSANKQYKRSRPTIESFTTATVEIIGPLTIRGLSNHTNLVKPDYPFDRLIGYHQDVSNGKKHNPPVIWRPVMSSA